MLQFLKRTWAEVDVNAIEYNYRAIRARLSDSCRFMAVVKADAYGHGAVHVARALQSAGADWFGVSNLQEAIQLRKNGITRPILILSYTPPEEAATLAAYGITQTVISGDYARRLNEAAATASVTLPVHIKLDTGMSRVGFFYHDEQTDVQTVEEITAVCSLSHLTAEGIFTHFACADEENGDAFTRRQFALFSRAVSLLEQHGCTFALKHCCNSAAALRYPEMQWDMVRPGIVLYGLHPSPVIGKHETLRPAMALKTVVTQVKEIPAHTEVSYGCTYKTTRPTRVATVPIGYADGYPRRLSNTAYMLAEGTRVPLIGRVCMDQSLLDVTDLPAVQEGTVVTVFGTDRDAEYHTDELAATADTINYEIVCDIGKRVPRLFIRDGNVIDKQDYFD